MWQSAIALREGDEKELIQTKGVRVSGNNKRRICVLYKRFTSWSDNWVLMFWCLLSLILNHRRYASPWWQCLCCSPLLAALTDVPSMAHCRHWWTMVGDFHRKGWPFTYSVIQETGRKELFQKEVMIEKLSIQNLRTCRFSVICAASSPLALPAVIVL